MKLTHLFAVALVATLTTACGSHDTQEQNTTSAAATEVAPVVTEEAVASTEENTTESDAAEAVEVPSTEAKAAE